jgi:hypothetical protein
METRVELVATISGERRLSIEPINGHTAEEVAQLLNSGEAHIMGHEVVQFFPPPAEGHHTLARIINNRDDVPPPVWSVKAPTA